MKKEKRSLTYFRQACFIRSWFRIIFQTALWISRKIWQIPFIFGEAKTGLCTSILMKTVRCAFDTDKRLKLMYEESFRVFFVRSTWHLLNQAKHRIAINIYFLQRQRNEAYTSTYFSERHILYLLSIKRRERGLNRRISRYILMF